MDNGQIQLSNIEKIYNMNNQKLATFFNESQETLQDLSQQLQQIQEDFKNFKITLDESMRKLEIDISKNDGMLANIVASSNLKLKKEKVSQNRITLLQLLKNLDNDLQTFQQNFNQICQTYSDTCQKIHQDFVSLKKDITNAANNLPQQQQEHQQIMESYTPLDSQQTNNTFKQAEDQIKQTQDNIKNNQMMSQINRLKTLSEDIRFKQ